MNNDFLIIGIWLLAVFVAAATFAIVWCGFQVKWLRRDMGKRSTMLAAILLGNEAYAQPREFVGPMPQVKIEKLWTPSDAQSNALADLMTLPAEARPRMRYIWLREPSAEGIKSLTVTLNRISRAQRIFRPTVLADFRLARLDLAFLTLIRRSEEAVR